MNNLPTTKSTTLKDRNLKKIQIINTEEKMSTLYSERKTYAKYTPPYSVLNPDTNSDSASEKSNGARCVSDKVVNTQRGSKYESTTEDREETYPIL